MDSKKLSDSKEVFDLVLKGKTNNQICEELEISESTVLRLKKGNEYIELRDRYNEMFMASAISQHRSHIMKIESLMPEAIAKLHTHMNSENEKIAIDAVKFLILTYHKMVSDVVLTTFNEMMDDYAQEK